MGAESKIKVVILGGDISGPMAAAKLVRYLPKSLYDITLIYPPTLERGAFFSHIPPSIKAFHRDLKIKESDFIKASYATFSLGTDVFEEQRSFIPFGPLGPILKDTAFHHVVQCTSSDDLYQLNLPARLAKEQKFLLPQSSGPLLLSGFDYGYHVNAEAYAKLLTAKAKDMGCHIRIGDITKVERKGEQINVVHIDNGEAVIGDIFIDCSGTHATLKPLDAGENWTAVFDLPSNYSIDITKLNHEPLTSASSTKFQPNLCSVTYQTQIENVSISFSNKGESLKSGWSQEPWIGNVISMGLASFSLPPIGGWNIRLIDEQIGRLIKFMPTSGAETSLKGEYNRLSNERISGVVDYALLFYRSGGDIHEFAERWPSAYYKYKYFKSRGGFAAMDYDDDWKDQWIAMLLSRYGWPDDVNVMAQEADESIKSQGLDDIKEAIQHIVSSASSHREFIAKNCAVADFIA